MNATTAAFVLGALAAIVATAAILYVLKLRSRITRIEKLVKRFMVDAGGVTEEQANLLLGHD